MPSWIKTPEDEAQWQKAKNLAAEQGHTGDWPYVTGIYKRLHGLLDKEAILSSAVAGEVRSMAPRALTSKLRVAPTQRLPDFSAPAARPAIEVHVQHPDTFPWHLDSRGHTHPLQRQRTEQWLRWAMGHDHRGQQIREPYQGALKDASIRGELGRLAVNVFDRAKPSLRQGVGAALEHLGRSIEQPRPDPVQAARLGVAHGLKELGAVVRNPAIPLARGAQGALRSAGAMALDHLSAGVAAPGVSQALGDAMRHGLGQTAQNLAGRIKQGFNLFKRRPSLQRILARDPRGIKPPANDPAYGAVQEWFGEQDLQVSDKWHAAGATADVVPLRGGRKWTRIHGDKPVVGRIQPVYHGIKAFRPPGGAGNPLGDLADFAVRAYGHDPVIIPHSSSLRPTLTHTRVDFKHLIPDSKLLAQVQHDGDPKAINALHPAAQKTLLRRLTTGSIREHGLYPDPKDLRPDQVIKLPEGYRLADGIFRNPSEVREWRPQLLKMSPEAASYHLTRGLDFHPSTVKTMLGGARMLLGAKHGSLTKRALTVPDEAVNVLRMAGGTLDDLLRLRALMGNKPEEETKGAAFGFPDKPDLQTHADLMRARSAFHRTRLRHQATFKKLQPKAQKEILMAYDAYHDAMEQAVLSGKLSPDTLR